MNNATGIAVASLAAIGSLFLFTPPASASNIPTQDASAEQRQSADSSEVGTNSSVTATRWYTEGASRYVTVRNNTAQERCFRVDIPGRADPVFTISANQTDSYRYGGTAWMEGRGIYHTTNC